MKEAKDGISLPLMPYKHKQMYDAILESSETGPSK